MLCYSTYLWWSLTLVVHSQLYVFCVLQYISVLCYSTYLWWSLTLVVHSQLYVFCVLQYISMLCYSTYLWWSLTLVVHSLLCVFCVLQYISMLCYSTYLWWSLTLVVHSQLCVFYGVSLKLASPVYQLVSQVFLAMPSSTLIVIIIVIIVIIITLSATGQHCPKIMKPPQRLPLQMAERLLRPQPDSVASHVTDRLIGYRHALMWLATETGWARSKCSGHLQW